MDREALIQRMVEVVGPDGVISERNQLRTYECDGLTAFRVIPSVVVLPETAAQVKAVAGDGFYYAPDPSSQQVCSIGGNVAENSGGAHCLKYGFTTNHVTGLEVVLPDGELVHLGGKAPDVPGYDLVGAFVGSEGTLGIATKVTVRVLRKPEAVRTLLAAFDSTDEAGATEIRIAQSDAERALFWKGRKSAFAAVGRISPDYYVQDGVIPRTALPEVLRKIADLSAERGLRVANVFHAGDGNLHPLVLYDADVEGQERRAEELSAEILRVCLEHGGSITGEHGVGFDKREFMAEQFSADDLDTMQLVRCAFDPDNRCNPGKVFPTPRLCGEAPGPRRVHPVEQAGLAEVW